MYIHFDTPYMLLVIVCHMPQVLSCNRDGMEALRKGQTKAVGVTVVPWWSLVDLTRGTLADVGLIILVRSDGIVFFLAIKGGNECCLYTNIIFREIEYGTSHFLDFISKVLGVSSVSSWFSFVFLNLSNRQSGFRSV